MNFERGKSVKNALGLGVFTKRVFPTDEHAAEYILSVLPQILLNGDREYHNNLRILQLYVIDYIVIDEAGGFLPSDVADPSLMWLIEHWLSNFGYENINAIDPNNYQSFSGFRHNI